MTITRARISRTTTSQLLCAALLAVAAQLCVASIVHAQEQECSPSGSANCAGTAANALIEKSRQRVDASLRRLYKQLPAKMEGEKGALDRNLPTVAKLRNLNAAWVQYSKNYCDTVWDLWTGAPPWKSATNRQCLAGAYSDYENFLATLETCVKSGEQEPASCERLVNDCTPTGCSVKPRRK